VRNPAQSSALAPVARGGIFRCDLPDAVDPAAFDGGAHALVHCAYDTRSEGGTSAGVVEDINVLSARRMIEACKADAVGQFVFISSLAAHADARSRYGRSKLQIEGMLDPACDAAVRPGTIVGDGGVFLRTRELVRRLPVLPLFFARDSRIQTVWIADLCAALDRIVAERRTGTFVIADEGVAIPEFYRAIEILEGRRPPLIPVPGDLALGALRLLERFGVRAPITSENLLGIKYLKYMSARDSQEKLGVTVRPFRRSLAELARGEQNERAREEFLRGEAV
jgi:NADH dehydrogenase